MVICKNRLEFRKKYVPAIIKRNKYNSNDLFLNLIKRKVQVRTIRNGNSIPAKISILTDSRTDFSGSAPKRYITKCYIKPKTVPYWYSESVFLNIGSTKRKYEEKIFFKEKLLPSRWSERMCTEVTTFPKNIMSEIDIPVEDVFIELKPVEE